MIKRILAAVVALSAALIPMVASPASAATDTKMYVTGYSYWDNDPPGSGEIAYPKIDGYPTKHNTAAGNGTYTNPTTVAVGLISGNPQFKPGTRFYIPAYRRYFVVEDSCADCGKGHNGYKWVDVWVDGRTSSVSNADNCMNKITGIHRVIVNPPNGYSVPTASAISRNNTCIALHTDALVLGANT